LTCPDDVNEWFWGGHLVHVSRAGSDLWSGFDNNQPSWFVAWFPSQNPTRCNVSLLTTKLIGSLNSTVTMINKTGIGLVVCKSVVHLGGSRRLSWLGYEPDHQDDIHRPKHFHAHPYHHLLTCPDDVNQWFWGGHLVHVSRAGSDLW
jgi:hypothetical protein